MAAIEHILTVDDDAEIRSLIKNYLEDQGYSVSTASNGQTMRHVMATREVDLVLLDLMMPGEDGLVLTRYLRENSSVGIIILTGKGDTVDRVVGLEMGADDYLAKPFAMRELLARIRSVSRRTTDRPEIRARRDDVARFAGWELDFAAQQLKSLQGERVPLTGAEFTLLAAMVNNPYRVLSRDKILDLVKQDGDMPFDRAVDVLVYRLRQKIEADPKHPALIKTVRGAGYMFTPGGEPT
jgi:DNA-binding response OmpR family regulator